MESNTTVHPDRDQIRQFVSAYRNLPVLWDAKCPCYSKKDKRHEAYEKLLHIYRKIRPEGTIMDVKKKINSIRSNFRKDLKKVEESAAIGVQYVPSSWLYEELLFLNDSEISFASGGGVKQTVLVSDDEDSKFPRNLSVENEPLSYPNQYSVKKRRYSESNQDETPTTTIQYSGKRPAKNSSDSSICDSSQRCDSKRTYNDDLAKVWAAKLDYLQPLQTIFAEKAINDILFEAQLGTLHRDSVKINTNDRTQTLSNVPDEIRSSDPNQSSPEYKFSQTLNFAENYSN